MPSIQNGSSCHVLSRLLDITVDPLFHIYNGLFNGRLGHRRDNSQQ